MVDMRADILRKRDTIRTASTHFIRRLWIVAAAAAVLFAADQRNAAIEMQLQTAIHREIVLGDLKGALEQYRQISSQQAAPREIAARAVFGMGQCQERLGRRADASASYNRVVREFADLSPAASARERLSNLEGSLHGPRNLDFSQPVPGKEPAGWFVPVFPMDPNSYVQLRRDGCRGGSGCAVVMVPPNAPSPLGHLMQNFSAAPYRGQTVRLRAWLRLEASAPEDRAQMMLSVDRANRQQGFFDNMEDRPVRSAEWTRCDLTAHIDPDATTITIAVLSAGRGRVWVDSVSFEVVDR
jgi:tetratricopeptide (TPR) repeat protein